ncbi:MAG TPA: glycoside hydrolase family 172 protein [Bacteroidales bacterium]|nr:glycoside hydrolase family 172 protein [Bacteroidales bacterium]
MKNMKILLLSSIPFLLISCNNQNSVPDIGLAAVTMGKSAAVSSHAPSANSNDDRVKYIVPGETLEMANIKGPGIINHIWLTFNEAAPNWLEANGSASPAEIVIRMYWDDSPVPAVEVPLGDFFAAGFGIRNEINSIPVIVEGGDGYNCFWTMPFRKSARITVTNDGEKKVRSFYYQVDYTKVGKLPENTGYFHARYRQEFPEKTGDDYLIMKTEGRGQYIGTVMSVRSRSPYWFGEGDAKFYIDGEKEPSVWGTGTEDYFLSAWGLNKCIFPYFGCTYKSADSEEDLGVKFTLYRWHLNDPVRFTKSLEFRIEHKGWMSADETQTCKVDGHVEREDDMATVAFWYQEGTAVPFATLPAYTNRKFPDLDMTTEGKDLMKGLRHSPGEITLQAGYGWTGAGQIFFTPSGDKAWLEAEFNLDREERRGIVLRLTKSYDYGIYKVLIDGVPIPEVPMTIDMDFNHPSNKPKQIDLYSSETVIQDYYLGSTVMKKGKHIVRFELTGKNDNSKGKSLGFDSFRLRERWNKKRASLN